MLRDLVPEFPGVVHPPGVRLGSPPLRLAENSESNVPSIARQSHQGDRGLYEEGSAEPMKRRGGV